MMQAHRSECTTTRAEQYRAQFLLRSTLMCAGVLVGSAVIMWVAANWSLWSHTKRIVLVTVAFTVPLLFAGRQGRYHPKDWAKPWSLSSIALLVAALMTGALLALLGQVYHSGADSWRLFAWWAVLLLPWALGLKSIPIILLTWCLTNVSIGLLIVTSFYFSAQYVMSACLAGWNALWFLVLLFWRVGGYPWGWGLRALSFAVFAFSFALAVVEYTHYHHADTLWSWPLGAGIVFLGVIAGLMLRWREDLLSWVGFSAAGLILVFHLSFTVLPHMGLGIYALLLVPLAALWLFAHMRRAQRHRRASPSSATQQVSPSAESSSKQSSNLSSTPSSDRSSPRGATQSLAAQPVWTLRGMRVLVLVVGAVFWVSFLSVWGRLPLPVLAWFLFALSMLLGVTRPWRGGRWWADLWLMTWVGALITITVVWSRGEFSPLGFVIVFLLAMLWYLWARAPLVRALTAAWLVFVCWAWPWIAPHSSLWQMDATVFDLRFGLLYAWVFLLAGAYHGLDRERQHELQPLLVASGFWLVVAGLLSWWVAAGWAQPGFGVPILSSVAAFVLVATMWLSLAPMLSALSTLVMAAGALGLAFVWWPNPWLVMAFTGIVYAGIHRQRAAMYLFLACFMFVLVRWYDATYLSLLDKVGRLLIGAGLVGTLSLALDHVLPKRTPSRSAPQQAISTAATTVAAPETVAAPAKSAASTASPQGSAASFQPAASRAAQASAKMSARQWLALCFGALAIYASSAWYLYVQDRILREGMSFELSLVPTDPRSLMQGDYMALRFGLSLSLQLLQQQHSEMAWPHLRLRVWVMPSKRHGARLYAVQVEGQDYLVQRLEHPLEAQFQGSDPHPRFFLIPITQPEVLQRAIPIMMEKKFGEWTPDGVNAWFFAEGQGMAYTEARWGRFKASGNGAVVLEALLNAEQQPIESQDR